jgi:hypothetical protein
VSKRIPGQECLLKWRIARICTYRLSAVYLRFRIRFASQVALVDRETFNRIKEKHGPYVSWAVWSEPDGRPKSNVGDLSVLDPDQNPALPGMLRGDVVMAGLNLSRGLPVPFGNFHDAKPEGQDYKIRSAFTGTPFYGAYMTDIIKEVVMRKAGGAAGPVSAGRDSVPGGPGRPRMAPGAHRGWRCRGGR